MTKCVMIMREGNRSKPYMKNFIKRHPDIFMK